MLEPTVIELVNRLCISLSKLFVLVLPLYNDMVIIFPVIPDLLIEELDGVFLVFQPLLIYHPLLHLHAHVGNICRLFKLTCGEARAV